MFDQKQAKENKSAHKKIINKIHLGGEMDVWEDKRLERFICGKEEMDVGLKWVGSWGQKLEHIDIAIIEDNKRCVLLVWSLNQQKHSPSSLSGCLFVCDHRR